MDSTHRHILDLSRRGALRGALGLAALAAFGPARGEAAAGDPFALGVASGDPWPDGFVIWTRLARAPLIPGGGMPPVPVEVAWEVAPDARFATILQAGTAVARPEAAHSVHVELGGLAPGRPYAYRFRALGHQGPVGRSRTAPAPEATPARVRLVNAGCQYYEHGFYAAWRHIAEEPELDLVFHYGDYIYEGPRREVGSRGWGTAVRSHEGGETLTLEGYRQRHAQYRLDPDLRAAHAAHPFAVSFDDHEVENNWAGPFSQRDGGPRFPEAVPPHLFALRKAAAFQAWYEHMPVRAATIPRGPEITAYRRLRFGRLALVQVLDTRSHRDDQPCGDRAGPPCEAVARPDAQMLGAAQEAWALEGLAQPAAWHVLAQQVPVMPHAGPSGAINMDKWDAYPAARARLLAGIAARGANAVVLAGDVHEARAGVLRAGAEAPAVATEFVATSIASGGDGAELPGNAATMRAANPHLAFLHARRGYTLHEMTAERMAVAFRALDHVSRPGAPRRDAGRFVVEAGRAEVVEGA
jgi:alkaline phosphatase D